MLYCIATAISEPVSVPCEPGEEPPKRSKPWLVIWPASSTECSRAGRHLSIAAYRNMKTGARNANSPPYSPKPRLTDSGLSTFRTLRDASSVQEFPANSEQFMERGTGPKFRHGGLPNDRPLM